MDKGFTLKLIGVVRNQVKEPRFGGWTNVISKIEVGDEYSEGVRGLEDYSHVVIVFWMNLVEACTITHRPQGRDDVPEVGIFACRCPSRPNPIGITTAELLQVNKEEGSLTVKGLDAIDGTPVLDIKPYTPQYDLYQKVKIPKWVNRLAY